MILASCWCDIQVPWAIASVLIVAMICLTTIYLFNREHPKQ